MANRQQEFLRKPVRLFEADMAASGLKRVLGKWGLTALGVGAIIGAGIFVLTGLGARDYAGPALALSFVVAGIGCTFAALCYAEFASILPVEGSAYAYSYATMGELFAWIIGWDLILEYAMGASTVAVGWSGYLVKLLGLFNVHLPLGLCYDVVTAKSILTEAAKLPNGMAELATHYSSLDLIGGTFAFNLPALLIVFLVTTILVRGIKEAASTNTLLVVLKVAVVLFIVIAGAQYVNVANWTPFIPNREEIINSSGHKHMAYGWQGILAGAAYIFFAYIGFDAVSTQAGEAKNPQKDVPFGIIVSLVLCTLLYILVALVLTGMVPFKSIDITAPISKAFSDVGLKAAATIISIAAVAGLTSVLIVMLMGQSRIFYALAKDGLLPKKLFGEVHKKFGTPWKASILTGFAVALVSAFTPIDQIAKMVNIGTLLAFVMVCVAVWIMRSKEPNRVRPFRTPWINFVAPAGIVANVGMMLSLEWMNWVRLVVWLGLGIVLYYAYGKRHSLLGAMLKRGELAQDVK